jgi:hypothetical protein
LSADSSDGNIGWAIVLGVGNDVDGRVRQSSLPKGGRHWGANPNSSLAMFNPCVAQRYSMVVLFLNAHVRVVNRVHAAPHSFPSLAIDPVARLVPNQRAGE